jgi:hypothetical protein
MHRENVRILVFHSRVASSERRTPQLDTAEVLNLESYIHATRWVRVDAALGTTSEDRA